MQPRHSDRPKMPGVPRPKPEYAHRPARHSVARPSAEPVQPVAPPVSAPRTRLGWSRSVLEQARSGQALGVGTPEPGARDLVERPRPVRSQAAARARAGEGFMLPVAAPAPPAREGIAVQPVALGEPAVEPVPYMEFNPAPVQDESSLGAVVRRWKQTLSSLFS